MGSLTTHILNAWHTRAAFHVSEQHNAYRIFHGALDGRDDLFIERFAHTAVISAYASLEDAEIHEICERLLNLFDPTLILLKERWRRDISTMAREGRVVYGEIPEESIQVLDSNMTFLVDPWHAQNTGLFLDARPARAWLKDHSHDLRVLNLFAYTGSLGVAAAVGGARSVTHVDNQRGLHQRISENHDLNSVPIEERDVVRDDCYERLKRSHKKGWSWDGIILDPPPRVPRKSGRRTPDQDYPKLARLALPCLRSDGWLLCFFNRWDASWTQMERNIQAAAEDQGASLSIAWRATSGADFPEQDPDRKLRMTAFQLD